MSESQKSAVAKPAVVKNRKRHQKGTPKIS
jgi:hypothetical protein